MATEGVSLVRNSLGPIKTKGCPVKKTFGIRSEPSRFGILSEPSRFGILLEPFPLGILSEPSPLGILLEEPAESEPYYNNNIQKKRTLTKHKVDREIACDRISSLFSRREEIQLGLLILNSFGASDEQQ
jgi:hypothetical protein